MTYKLSSYITFNEIQTAFLSDEDITKTGNYSFGDKMFQMSLAVHTSQLSSLMLDLLGRTDKITYHDFKGYGRKYIVGVWMLATQFGVSLEECYCAPSIHSFVSTLPFNKKVTTKDLVLVVANLSEVTAQLCKMSCSDTEKLTKDSVKDFAYTALVNCLLICKVYQLDITDLLLSFNDNEV